MKLSKKKKFFDDLKSLQELSEKMLNSIMETAAKSSDSIDKESLKELKKQKKISFDANYQKWYTESCAFINQILPDRLQEFKQYYLPDPKRKTYSEINYCIQDWLNGVRSQIHSLSGEKYFDDISIIIMKYNNQCRILDSGIRKFESSLMEIRQILQADLFDSEIQMAEELRRKGFLRAAGVICGVIIEKHLQEVCNNHKIIIKKKNPTIGDFNDKLKESDVIDVPLWRKIQRLGDIRTLSSHKKNREPSQNEIDELLQETDKLIKSLF